jgi:hypothetical protein
MRYLLLLALTLALPACDDQASDPIVDAGVDCPAEGDCYAIGLSKTGSALTVRLTDAQPAPPSMGDNLWDFEVLAGDAPQTGCAITLLPLMPAHGHGSNTQPVTTELGEGRYHAEPLDLFMRGLWTIDFSLDCGGVTDEVQFSFWIEG